MISRLLILLSALFITACASRSQTNTGGIPELLERARVSDSLMDCSASVKYYSEILTIDSTQLIALINRGRAYVWLGQTGKGFADFDKAVRLYPHERTYYTRGAAYIKIMSYDKAGADLQKSAELNPDFAEAWYYLGLVKAYQDSLDRALQLCEKADKISYQQRLSRLVRFTVYQKKGDFSTLADELTAAINEEPANAVYYNDRGMAKNELQQYREAISDFDQAIALNPKMAFAYNNKAFALIKLKQTDSAMMMVSTSLELDAENAWALKNRALIWNALNDSKRACTDLKAAGTLSTDRDLTAEIKVLTEELCRE